MDALARRRHIEMRSRLEVMGRSRYNHCEQRLGETELRLLGQIQPLNW